MTHVKRVARIVSGFLLLLVGMALLVLPGPGWLVIALGLALLAPDFRWAQSALDRLKHGADTAVAWWRRRPQFNRTRR